MIQCSSLPYVDALSSSSLHCRLPLHLITAAVHLHLSPPKTISSLRSVLEQPPNRLFSSPKASWENFFVPPPLSRIKNQPIPATVQTTHRRSWSLYYCFSKLQFLFLTLLFLILNFFKLYSHNSDFAPAGMTAESGYERKRSNSGANRGW
jgi:hypothetical protein